MCVFVLYQHVCVVLLTWPLDLVRVTQVSWGGEKHLSVGDRRPERNHVESAVVSDRSILLRVNYFSYRMRKNRFI